MDSLYHISNENGTFSVSLEWNASQGIEEFMMMIKTNFSLSDEQSFRLIDAENCSLVLSKEIPPGSYVLHVVDNKDAFRRIVEDYGHSDEDQLRLVKKQSENPYEMDEFQSRFLKIAFADSMIINERTWLAWTRTSLNIMTCCFTFLFIDSWNEEPTYKKIWCNICVIGFAMSFAGCFVVGYLRYRNLVNVLKDRSYESSYADLDVDYFHLHTIWVRFLGCVLVVSSLVFLFVLQETEDGSISVD